MLRHRLTDQQWELVQDLFPPPARTGRPRRDRREILDGILWILRTGAPWRDLPGELGPWATVWDLFDTWNHDGTLEAIPSRLRSAGIDAGLVDRELWCVDGTIIRAARCAGGGHPMPRPSPITSTVVRRLTTERCSWWNRASAT